MTVGPPLVVVVHAGRTWRAEIPALGVYEESGNLSRINRWVHHQLGPGWIDYRFETGDPRLDRLVSKARHVRRAGQLALQDAHELAHQVLTAPGAAALSMRDLSVLLSISHQRIQQMRAATDPGSCGTRT